MNKKLRFAASLAFLAFLLTSVGLTIAVVKRDQQTWLPDYVLSLLNGTNNKYSVDQTRHIMFLIVDHHEHPFDSDEARKSSKAWNATYSNLVRGLKDHYGNPFKYTWFYRNDYRSADVILELNKLVFEGLGEIELHWHHSHKDEATFIRDLDDSVRWFNSFGAMVTSGEPSKPAFGFVHGNWSLDNSLGERYCGVNSELSILHGAGSYADFTFSSGSLATPRISSSIYYAVDDSEPKSYDDGVRSAVGKKNNGFMIFQGPSLVDFRKRVFEHGAVEAWMGSNWEHRVKLWYDSAPYVQGRPEWRFVKVYTHGVQSRATILTEKFPRMVRTLLQIADDRGVKLHFVTAREAFNIVKAAENGETGDPELYRDYEIEKPVNRILKVNRQFEEIRVGKTCTNIRLQDVESVDFLFRNLPIRSVKGKLIRLIAAQNEETYDVALLGEGIGHIQSTSPLNIHNNLVTHNVGIDGLNNYEVMLSRSGPICNERDVSCIDAVFHQCGGMNSESMSHLTNSQ